MGTAVCLTMRQGRNRLAGAFLHNSMSKSLLFCSWSLHAHALRPVLASASLCRQSPLHVPSVWTADIDADVGDDCSRSGASVAAVAIGQVRCARRVVARSASRNGPDGRERCSSCCCISADVHGYPRGSSDGVVAGLCGGPLADRRVCVCIGIVLIAIVLVIGRAYRRLPVAGRIGGGPAIAAANGIAGNGGGHGIGTGQSAPSIGGSPSAAAGGAAGALTIRSARAFQGAVSGYAAAPRPFAEQQRLQRLIGRAVSVCVSECVFACVQFAFVGGDSRRDHLFAAGWSVDQSARPLARFSTRAFILNSAADGSVCPSAPVQMTTIYDERHGDWCEQSRAPAPALRSQQTDNDRRC
jgi:hypothetical protein